MTTQYAVINGHSLKWLWDQANITVEDAEDYRGHVRALTDVLAKLEAPEGLFYSPRGIGLNWLPCLVCGKHPEDAQPDMAAFVDGRSDGEEIVAMFEKYGATAKLDYRPSEPTWVQVKVGACNEHLAHLKLLEMQVGFDRHITESRIKYVLGK